MSPVIQTSTQGRKLQRGLRLTELPDAILAPEIVGVILLEDWSAPLSDDARGCAGGSLQAAVAAEFPMISLVRVGAPPQYDLVVNGITISSTTTQRVGIQLPTVGLTGITVSSDTAFLDRDVPGRPTSQVGRLTGAAILAGPFIWEGFILANTPVQVPVAIRLGSTTDGDGNPNLIVIGETLNTNLLVSFDWEESSPQG